MFKDMFQMKKKQIDGLLKIFLPQEEKYEQLIYEAMSYSLFAGGKRLRPILLQASYELMGGQDQQEIEPFMVGIEMIHTYSLIHDDLPAMDNDDFRRGKPTNHKVYGEAMGILAGDALLNTAFEIMLKSCSCGNIEKKLRALRVIAGASGTKGMLGGQVVDMQFEHKKINADILEYIHLHKTARLIEAAVVSGGILGGASEQQLQMLKEYGESIGLAFQIQDDILDETGTFEELGKPIHSDEINGKTTFVSLYGMEKAKNTVDSMTNKALKILTDLNEKDTFLHDLTMYLLNRKN